MSIFDKIFGNRSDRELKQKLLIIQKNVVRENKPLGDIAFAIIKASNQCFEKTKYLIIVPTDEEKQRIEIFVFYEFIYFFMHMTSRAAFSEMSEQQIQKLKEFITPIIVETAINSFFNHWPDDYKSKMSSDFYEKLNSTELEYSKSKKIYSKEEPFTSDALFSMLARNIAEVMEDAMNPEIIVIVLSISSEEFIKMKLPELIQSASKIL